METGFFYLTGIFSYHVNSECAIIVKQFEGGITLETLFDITQLPEDVQVLYQSLAPACQREWARYVLSAADD